MKIINFFIERKYVVNMMSAFICLFGLVSLFDMKRDLIPPFAFKMISVEATLPGASTLEMEKLVTFPIEESLKGLPGLVKTSSTTSHSSSSIQLQYEAGYDDMDNAVSLVRSRVQALRTRLPVELQPIQVEQQKVTEVFLSVYAIENFQQDNPVHRAHLQALQKKIESIPNVVRTEAYVNPRDIYVKLDPEKLKRHGVSAGEIRRRLADSLAYTPVGRVRHDEVDLVVELAQSNLALADIGNIPVAGNRRGDTVFIKDVANVVHSIGQVDSKSYIDGNESIYFRVMKDTSSDSITLSEKVQKVVDETNKTLPAPLRTKMVFEGPKFIKKQLDVLWGNGIGGLVMVVIVLMTFLNLKTALMALLGVPVSYLGTIVVLSMMGINVDLISIVGMILVVGILVDDAIIISERYVENLSAGMTPKVAASRAASELILPVTGTILTTIVTFLPILMVKSEIVTVLYAIPVVIISSLAISWFESFFILPNHLAHYVKTPPKEHTERLIRRLRKGYETILGHTLKWRYVYCTGLIAVAGFAFFVAGTKLKHEFNLSIGNERLDIFVTLKKSASLEETVQKLKPIHALLESLEQKGIGSIDSNVGSFWRDGRNYQGFRYARARIWIDPEYAYPKDLKAELMKKLEPELTKIKTAEFEDLTVKESKQGEDESKKNLVSVRIRGTEHTDFGSIEQAIVKAAANQGSLGDWVKPEDRDQEGWEFVAKPAQLIRYGLSQSDLGAQMKQIFSPHELTQMRVGGESIRLYTQLDLPVLPDLKRLDQYEILTPMGTSVPLKFLGEWRHKRALKSVAHRDARRVMTIDFRFDPAKTNELKAKGELKAKLEPVRASYASHDIEVIDANEQDADAQAWALKVGLYSVLGVMFVLAIVLGSLTQPLVVAAPVPFGIVGIIWALYLHDMPLGLMAIIGLIGTIGVAVNDSLVMTDQINKLVAERGGKFERTAIIAGASSRLRAILLTSVTTVVGVFPMAYGVGGESGFTQPLAFAMAWGLSFSTLLTLFILPALLEIRADLGSLGKKIGRRLSRVFTKTNRELNEFDHADDSDLEPATFADAIRSMELAPEAISEVIKGPASSARSYQQDDRV